MIKHPWWHWFFTNLKVEGSIQGDYFNAKSRYFRVWYCSICKVHKEENLGVKE